MKIRLNQNAVEVSSTDPWTGKEVFNQVNMRALPIKNRMAVLNNIHASKGSAITIDRKHKNALAVDTLTAKVAAPSFKPVMLKGGRIAS